MNLNEKIVIVTGGSKGLGKGIAQAMVGAGARVIITSTIEGELNTAAQDIGAEAYKVDASSKEQTIKLAEDVVKKYGRIDIWLNNAGVQIAPSSIEEVSEEKLQRLFSINFFGYFYGVQAAIKIMKQQESGLIININSTAGLSGKPGLSAYVSSKFALKGLAESAREDLKDTDIGLYQIFPGGIQTDIYHEEVPADIDAYMSIDYAVEKIMSNLKSKVPDPDFIIRRPTAR
jgi:NAD(P)-dependent dehydrogenase (short-subunit alcohol dehydrogenase family)